MTEPLPKGTEVENLPPFTSFLASNIPAVYDNTMSYYDELTALIKYIEDTLIPAVNDNAEAVTTLSNFCTELKEYVDHYFDNLDVQEEINNKLDEMAETGELGNIMRVLVQEETLAIRSDLANFEETINTQIDELDNKVNSATTGTPLVASSTSEMTDTSRIYVNTTDGEWYYYDGSNWTSGGEYQTTGIGDNSISIYKLDDDLSEEFIKEYENVSFDPTFQGFCKVSGTSVVIDTNSSFAHDVITLDNATTYEFSGWNFYDVVGLIITDSDDNVVVSTRPQSTTGDPLTYVNLRFTTYEAGMKAYISNAIPTYASIPQFAKDGISLIKLTNISQNYKNNTLALLQTKDNEFVHTQTVVGQRPSFTTAGDHYHIKSYKLNAGVKYTASSENYLYIVGICITDNKFKVLYSSSNASVAQRTPISYTFTASADGYIFLSYDDRNTIPAIKIESALDSAVSKYSGKTWCAMGDSLTDPSTLGSSVKNYVNYVAEDLGITAINYGHGGAGYKARDGYSQAFYQISTTLSSPDVVTVFGSFNDTYGILDTYGWGNITDHNTTTICGCMNTTFDNLITDYPNAVIGVIIPTPWKNRNNVDTSTASDPDATERAEKYVEKLKQICEMRSIPYLDLYTKSNLYFWDADFRDAFSKDGDGTHPNTDGHKKISGQIEEFIKRILY